MIGEAILRQAPVRRRSVEGDAELERLTAFRDCRSLVAAPLSHAGESIGVMLFGHPDPGVFGEPQSTLLTAMAEQTMIALQNSRRFQDLHSDAIAFRSCRRKPADAWPRSDDGPTQSLATIAMRASFARRLLGATSLPPKRKSAGPRIWPGARHVKSVICSSPCGR